MASSYLTRQTTVPTSEKKFTFSTWMKVSGKSGTDNGIIEWYRDSNDRYSILLDSSTTQLRAYGVVSGTNGIGIYSNMTFLDPAAWYHVCIHSDTTQGSAGDRFKLWVNGVAQTFASYSFTFSNSNINVMDGTSGDAVIIGTRNETAGNSFDGTLADTYYVDGALIAYTEFGSTDSTTGEWKPKLDPTISSYGNAGFHLTYEDASNLGDDTSGNSKDMTAVGTITQTKDNPSHGFATLNPLYNQTTGQGVVLANGNTRCSYSSDSSRSAFGTIAIGTGKYYFEAKLNTVGTSPVIGIVNTSNYSDINGASGYAFHDDALNFGYGSDGQKYSNGGSSFGNSFTANDIIGVAIDKTNNKLYFSKNGTWQNSGDPTSGSTGTGSAFNLASNALYASACRIRNGGDWSFNFGNGYFGTTAVSSAGSNASGIGVFEYDVPTGYTALSTKGLNE